jgi:hypothetical protein
MTKKVGAETSPAVSTWPVRPIYMTKNAGPYDFHYSLFKVCTAYINDEKCKSRDFPYSLYMACTAYILEEKRWSRDFP